MACASPIICCKIFKEHARVPQSQKPCNARVDNQQAQVQVRRRTHVYRHRYTLNRRLTMPTVELMDTHQRQLYDRMIVSAVPGNHAPPLPFIPIRLSLRRQSGLVIVLVRTTRSQSAIDWSIPAGGQVGTHPYLSFSSGRTIILQILHTV